MALPEWFMCTQNGVALDWFETDPRTHLVGLGSRRRDTRVMRAYRRAVRAWKLAMGRDGRANLRRRSWSLPEDDDGRPF